MGKPNINDTVLRVEYYTIDEFTQNIVQNNYTEVTKRPKESVDYMMERSKNTRSSPHPGHYKHNSTSEGTNNECRRGQVGVSGNTVGQPGGTRAQTGSTKHTKEGPGRPKKQVDTDIKSQRIDQMA